MKPLLVVRHVPWEGPHRILRAFDGVPTIERCILDGDPLPDHDQVRAAVFMGGPMSVNDTHDHPGLVHEVAWLRDAAARDLPVLGVCLGAQLLAAALGSRVGPGARKELGVAPIRIHADDDPIAGELAPTCRVLHWHGEVFDLPDGATLLASSELTAVQGFRYRRAWGFLFHAEADADLVDLWLAEPSMAAEACEALGPHAARMLRADAAQLDPDRGDRAFAAFAALT